MLFEPTCVQLDPLVDLYAVKVFPDRTSRTQYGTVPLPPAMLALRPPVEVVRHGGVRRRSIDRARCRRRQVQIGGGNVGEPTRDDRRSGGIDDVTRRGPSSVIGRGIERPANDVVGQRHALGVAQVRIGVGDRDGPKIRSRFAVNRVVDNSRSGDCRSRR